MGEERYRKRVLETWPCGCRMWRIYTRVGDSIEQKELERREMCWGLESLFELRERAEQRQARAYSERGEHSPEYSRLRRLTSTSSPK